MPSSPIFSKLHDLLLWLLRVSRKFPREYRFTLAEELTRQGFALQEALVSASKDKKQTAKHLTQADVHLTCVSRTLLICHKLELLDAGQYRHGASMANEVGRLLGGWQRSL